MPQPRPCSPGVCAGTASSRGVKRRAGARRRAGRETKPHLGVPRTAQTGQASAGPTAMHVCAYTGVHGHTHAYRHVCVPVSVYAHVCVFSSLQRLLDLGSRSPGLDSARVRQRRAATKSPDSCLPFSTSSVNTAAASHPAQKVPASRKRFRDRGQRCTAV